MVNVYLLDTVYTYIMLYRVRINQTLCKWIIEKKMVFGKKKHLKLIFVQI